METIKKTVYRFKIDEELNKELFRFAKNHQFDHRKDFKNDWIEWRKEMDDLFQIEIKKHLEQGYKGDIEDKIFKSARYYFRKKQEKTRTEKKAPKEQVNHYITCNKELLETMDQFIKENIQMKPADSFRKFCNENIEMIKKEIKELYHIHNISNLKEINEKIKKTFKNRYYTILYKEKEKERNTHLEIN